MTFGATPDIGLEFNFYEALFWLLLGIGVLVSVRRVPRRWRGWTGFTAANLLLFGVSDLVELFTGGFLHTAPWLLGWKVLHVIGLCVSIGWYVILRYTNER